MKIKVTIEGAVSILFNRFGEENEVKLSSGSRPAQTGDPRWAYQQGSNLLVMGRDIYQAEDSIKRIDEIEKWCLS